MDSRLGKHLLRAKSKTENYGLFTLYSFYFFICCLGAPWLTFGHYWGNSFTYLVLITAFVLSTFGPKVTQGVGSLHLVEYPLGFDNNGITHLPIHPNGRKYSSQTWTQIFQNVKMPPIPKTVIAWHCGGL